MSALALEILRTYRSLRQRLRKRGLWRHQVVIKKWAPYPQPLWSRLWITCA
ncbi:hypothetical protein C4K25_5311 [Pseudomonas chlororaphis]|nr:hypothetical protein C4K25_5311 [Pseudomonas chlororaphis]